MPSGARPPEAAADYDLIVGPTASYAIGSFALLGQAGVSAVKSTTVEAGAIALGGGVAGSF
jgi:hypothetical protein